MNDNRPILIELLRDSEVRKAFAAGNRVGAIKLVRERTGLGLKEAKDVVDSWPGIPLPSSAPYVTHDITALKIICDVLNHQPPERRSHILAAAAILSDASLPGAI